MILEKTHPTRSAGSLRGYRVQPSRQLLTIIVWAILLNWPVFPQVALQITAIGDAPYDSPEIWVSEKSDISGTISMARADSAELVLQTAWRRLNGDTWWISDQIIPLSGIPGQARNWRFSDVPLGTPFDYKKPLEIVTFAVDKQQTALDGVIDFASLVYLSKAVSQPLLVQRQPKTPANFSLTPRIRIDDIAGQPAQPGATHEVGLQALLSGEVRKPTDSLVRLVVQPLSSDRHWVVEDEPYLREGRWSGKIDFAVGDLEDESEFIVFAVVAREELPRGSAIPLEAWQGYLHHTISGISTLLRVTRVEIPPAKNQIGVRILSVGGRMTGPERRGEAQVRSSVKGILSGRPISTAEDVWLLTTRDFRDDSWHLLGKAAIKNGKYWEISPRLLGESGSYIKLMAVVAGRNLAAGAAVDVEACAAFSRPVHLRLQDAPPLEVEIEQVDRQPVADASSDGLAVYRISGVEGRIGGRPLEDEDKVWVLKMPNDSDQPWQLLGQAGFKNRHTWELPPLALGAAGDELILIAVIAKTPIQSLNLREQASVIASSGRVQVRLKD